MSQPTKLPTDYIELSRLHEKMTSEVRASSNELKDLEAIVTRLQSHNSKLNMSIKKLQVVACYSLIIYLPLTIDSQALLSFSIHFYFPICSAVSDSTLLI